MKKIVTTAVALLMSTALVVAAPHGKGKGEKGNHGRKAHSGKSMEERHEQMAQRLGLSEAQKQQLRDIRERRQDENREFASRMRDAQREYHELRKSNDPRAEAARADVERYRDEAKVRRTETREEMLRILTPDQRRQFDEMRAKRDSRRSTR